MDICHIRKYVFFLALFGAVVIFAEPLCFFDFSQNKKLTIYVANLERCFFQDYVASWKEDANGLDITPILRSKTIVSHYNIPQFIQPIGKNFYWEYQMPIDSMSLNVFSMSLTCSLTKKEPYSKSDYNYIVEHSKKMKLKCIRVELDKLSPNHPLKMMKKQKKTVANKPLVPLMLK